MVTTFIRRWEKQKKVTFIIIVYGWWRRTLSLLETNVTLFQCPSSATRVSISCPLRTWSSSSTKDSPRISPIRDLPHHCLLPQNHPPLPLRLVATPLNLCWYFLARVSRQSAWSHVRVLEKLQHASVFSLVHDRVFISCSLIIYRRKNFTKRIN